MLHSHSSIKTLVWVSLIRPSRSTYLDFLFRGLSRLVAGAVGDFRRINRLALVGAAGIFCGVFSVTSILFQTFNALIIYCVFFGIGSGMFYNKKSRTYRTSDRSDWLREIT